MGACLVQRGSTVNTRGPVECPEEVKAVLDALQIPYGLIAARTLVLHPEAEELVLAETGDNGREHLLVPAAAKAWRDLSGAALSDGIAVKIVSAFRSVDRQAEIVRAKLARGLSLEDILCVSAPPGYSEHHTGCAVDINTPGCVATEEPFEDTNAFRWLRAHAGGFGFTLSYPRGNALGFAYEPWH